ncbi:glutathione peroxidase [Philodulcilactobacillus myokoensis]|uniref:Glutathione peroxidase n=1 Tax=Philodulcilactobacillus myokoensis TaxID=2929573 RepID=A0A9W6B0Z8_9LACO|nr:glutathione peroxidase [Philodulcilactobacillus myokoensis]GLB46408.1 glutathione peroxidase [Philodulcilactobacillus myokoensis]
MASIYDFKETEMGGETIDFNRYRGHVLLVVNTASKCGLAPQLKGIESLYQKYHEKGFEVIGLPSNQFHQEFQDDEKTDQYCHLHYGVTFPMTKHVAVNGDDADPLFTHLKSESGHGRIKWNYTKFLINQSGDLVHRYAPVTKPEKMEATIKSLLNE